MLTLGYGIIYGFLAGISDLPFKWMDFNNSGWISMSEVWRSTDTLVVEKMVRGVKCREYRLVRERKTIKLDCDVKIFD